MDRIDGYKVALAALSKEFFATCQRMRSRIPNLSPEGDVRTAAFSKCQNGIDAVIVGMVCWQERVSQSDFFPPGMPVPDQRIVRYQFSGLLHRSLADGVFMAMESSLRSTIRSLDPQAYSGGNAVFKSIYGSLLARLGLVRWEPMLDFYRTVRNTIHNNGVFYPLNGRNLDLNFNGKRYLFEVGKLVDFITWETTFEIVSQVRAMMEEILSHPQVAGLGSIPDPGPRMSL